MRKQFGTEVLFKCSSDGSSKDGLQYNWSTEFLNISRMRKMRQKITWGTADFAKNSRFKCLKKGKRKKYGD